MLKKIIQKCFDLIGLKISRKIKKVEDLSVYNRLYNEEILKIKPFYNIGAGLFSHPMWTNIDFSNTWYKDNKMHIQYDLMELKKLPIADNTAEIVYSSHTLEHITDEAINNILLESYRILKKNGVIRITLPDTDLYYKAFINNDTEFYRDSIQYYSNPEVMKKLELHSMDKSTLGSIFLYYFAATVSPLTKYTNEKKINDNELNELFLNNSYEDALNYITSFCFFDPEKSGYHINWVNSKKIIEILNKIGFSDVYVSSYGQSESPILRDTNYFDNTVPSVSCYIEARK